MVQTSCSVKLNETIEVSALWSTTPPCAVRLRDLGKEAVTHRLFKYKRKV